MKTISGLNRHDKISEGPGGNQTSRVGICLPSIGAVDGKWFHRPLYHHSIWIASAMCGNMGEMVTKKSRSWTQEGYISHSSGGQHLQLQEGIIGNKGFHYQWHRCEQVHICDSLESLVVDTDLAHLIYAEFLGDRLKAARITVAFASNCRNGPLELTNIRDHQLSAIFSPRIMVQS